MFMIYCFLLVMGHAYGAVVGGKMEGRYVSFGSSTHGSRLISLSGTYSPTPTPTPSPQKTITSYGPTPVIGLQGLDVKAQLTTLIETITQTVSGTCTPTPASVSYYAKRDGSVDSWVGIAHEAIDEQESKNLAKAKRQFENSPSSKGFAYVVPSYFPPPNFTPLICFYRKSVLT